METILKMEGQGKSYKHKGCITINAEINAGRIGINKYDIPGETYTVCPVCGHQISDLAMVCRQYYIGQTTYQDRTRTERLWYEVHTDCKKEVAPYRGLGLRSYKAPAIEIKNRYDIAMDRDGKKIETTYAPEFGPGQN